MYICIYIYIYTLMMIIVIMIVLILIMIITVIIIICIITINCYGDYLWSGLQAYLSERNRYNHTIYYNRIS